MDRESIRKLIADHLGVAPSRAGDAASFRDDLGADSLDLIELPMLLEHHLGIVIADEESECCATVGEALRLVRDKLAPGPLAAAISV
ncbi:acyl carrier protein [Sphingomonas parva]|uniref:Acyl carrier protein n=1 Tax=Sphingomonas parva TaxID=2555898 RepID=A0A4Y8ZYI7_9SPHN|nr:acyl carrier protein [Sphingomonas parva]TFI59666.1 acyl carrier protein [Sphingomonas parva]